jgi:hypothetical protein
MITQGTSLRYFEEMREFFSRKADLSNTIPTLPLAKSLYLAFAR